MSFTRFLSLFLLAWLTVPAAAFEQVDISPAIAKVLATRHPRTVDELRLMESHVQAVAKQATPATVGVEVGWSIGSGVIISPEGLVLTAAHVIGKPGLPAKIVLPDGRKLEGHTLGVNHTIDAGMVQIANPPADLPFLPVADGQRPEIGHWVVATGQPGGMHDDRAPPVRLGRVLAGEQGWICTDCTLVGGDSGGPLINMRGEVTAIHTSIGPSIVHNFHVPVALIQEEWQRLLDGESWGKSLVDDEPPAGHPLLGISGRTAEGHCIVTQVFPEMPAAKAGVQVGDLILEVDGDQVKTFEGVARRVFAKNPGATMHLKLQRGEETIEMDIVLSAVRAPRSKEAPLETGPPEQDEK